MKRMHLGKTKVYQVSSLPTLIQESRTDYQHQNAIFTCCSCIRRLKYSHPINATAGTFHTDAVVVSIQCVQTGIVRSAFYMACGNIYSI